MDKWYSPNGNNISYISRILLPANHKSTTDSHGKNNRFSRSDLIPKPSSLSRTQSAHPSVPDRTGSVTAKPPTLFNFRPQVVYSSPVFRQRAKASRTRSIKVEPRLVDSFQSYSNIDKAIKILESKKRIADTAVISHSPTQSIDENSLIQDSKRRRLMSPSLIYSDQSDLHRIGSRQRDTQSGFELTSIEQLKKIAVPETVYRNEEVSPLFIKTPLSVAITTYTNTSTPSTIMNGTSSTPKVTDSGAALRRRIPYMSPREIDYLFKTTKYHSSTKSPTALDDEYASHSSDELESVIQSHKRPRKEGTTEHRTTQKPEVVDVMVGTHRNVSPAAQSIEPMAATPTAYRTSSVARFIESLDAHGMMPSHSKSEHDSTSSVQSSPMRSSCVSPSAMHSRIARIRSILSSSPSIAVTTSCITPLTTQSFSSPLLSKSSVISISTLSNTPLTASFTSSNEALKLPGVTSEPKPGPTITTTPNFTFTAPPPTPTTSTCQSEVKPSPFKLPTIPTIVITTSPTVAFVSPSTATTTTTSQMITVSASLTGLPTTQVTGLAISTPFVSIAASTSAPSSQFTISNIVASSGADTATAQGAPKPTLSFTLPTIPTAVLSSTTSKSATVFAPTLNLFSSVKEKDVRSVTATTATSLAASIAPFSTASSFALPSTTSFQFSFPPKTTTNALVTPSVTVSSSILSNPSTTINSPFTTPSSNILPKLTTSFLATTSTATTPSAPSGLFTNPVVTSTPSLFTSPFPQTSTACGTVSKTPFFGARTPVVSSTAVCFQSPATKFSAPISSVSNSASPFVFGKNTPTSTFSFGKKSESYVTPTSLPFGNASSTPSTLFTPAAKSTNFAVSSLQSTTMPTSGSSLGWLSKPPPATEPTSTTTASANLFTFSSPTTLTNSATAPAQLFQFTSSATPATTTTIPTLFATTTLPSQGPSAPTLFTFGGHSMKSASPFSQPVSATTAITTATSFQFSSTTPNPSGFSFTAPTTSASVFSSGFQQPQQPSGNFVFGQSVPTFTGQQSSAGSANPFAFTSSTTSGAPGATSVAVQRRRPLSARRTRRP